MFRIGVCDDEAYFRQDIEKRLEAYFKGKPFEPEIHIFEKGQALLEEAEKKPFDLVFLDIEMPDMDGITLGACLKTMFEATLLIYVTSYDAYVSHAFRLDAFQYLKKPLDDSLFQEEIDRALAQYVLKKQKYNFEYNSVRMSVPITALIYLESQSWSVIIHTKDKDYKIVGKLNEEEERLAVHGFIRIHQSYLINMQYINKFLSDKVFLKDREEPLPVSRKYKNEAKKAHLDYQSKVGI